MQYPCMSAAASVDAAMQVERSIYDAASRAVQHQRNPDGSVRQDPPSEPGVGVTPPAAGQL